MILKKYKTSTPVVYFDGKTPVEIPNYCKRRTKVRGIWVSGNRMALIKRNRCS